MTLSGASAFRPTTRRLRAHSRHASARAGPGARQCWQHRHARSRRDLQRVQAQSRYVLTGLHNLLHVACTASDRLSRSPGHLEAMMQATEGDVCITCTEVNVAAAIVGWDRRRPQTPWMRPARRGSSSWQWASQRARLDAEQLQTYDLRIALMVLTALKQLNLHKPSCCP